MPSYLRLGFNRGRIYEWIEAYLALFGASVDIVGALVVALENVGLDLAHARVFEGLALSDTGTLGSQAGNKDAID